MEESARREGIPGGSAASSPPRSLLSVAGLVAGATLLSKGMGFVRQALIAAVYGSGPEYSAFSIAYVLPGFLLILLGGINGPFHSAIVSVLKKQQPGREDPARWLESISTLVGCLLLAVTLGLWWGADWVVHLSAPGASPEVHVLAAQQLRIMAPLALLSGWIGIGFGALNAAEHYLLPALSPLISSLAVIGILVTLGWTGIPTLLAWGVLIGAIAQWLAQVPLQIQLGLGRLRLRFDWGSPPVRAVGLLLLPAVVSSGMIHINVYVDLFFASFVPGDRTIGNLGYAQLLVQTPLGILSNMVLVPLMPLYAQLAGDGSRWLELRQRIRQGLMVTAILTLPLAMLLVALAEPIVQIAYQRGRFTPEVTQEVAALLRAYGLGISFYLLRDVLVRIFYALEDGATPLRISGLSIGLNALLDFLFLPTFGAPGIALATAGVNLMALIGLGIRLHQRLPGIPWREMGQALLPLLGITTLAGGLSHWLWTQLHSHEILGSPLLTAVLGASLAAGLGLSLFAAGALYLQIPEVEWLAVQLQARLPKIASRRSLPRS
ncbi:murein biosynthesis integral membrane protein MurJ [Synechococcus sp. H60.3]|uniref:murein biosynthesis integral membrane protein MurJ n=1 Tax=Synechococcus sp. H60.3 TaxID=2967124 RepID=UPI0039C37B2F